MNNNEKKKEILAQYKEREIIGGAYIIRNTLENKLLLDATTDLQSIKNRFEFSQKTGSCVYPKLQKDWSEHGGSAFVLEVLEELKKGGTQTDVEYKADIGFLKEMWLEKLSKDGNLY
jgi:hypothetical protein